MPIIRVAVLRGGPSEEYEISLKTGQNVLNSLKEDKYKSEDIFIDKSGVWYRGGFPLSPERALSGIDVVFNALHGAYGEDGTLQRLLEHTNTPFTGSKSFSSSLGFNKVLSKDIYRKNHLKTPEHIVLSESDEDLHKIALRLFREFPQPSIIKPVSGGSSKDVYFCSSYEDVYTAIDTLSRKGEPFMIEEFIFGKEASVPVVEDYRGEKLYSFLPVEIGKKGNIFDYSNKYEEMRDDFYPGRFNREEKDMLMELSREAHEALGLRHYSQSDFIVSPRGIYILETNSLPGLTKNSLLSKTLETSDILLADFVEHLINLAIEG